jgi:hypothetical protein
MDMDESKIDEAVLGLLYLTSFTEHGIARAWKGHDWKGHDWKGHDWEALNRLYAQGFIEDPRNRNKSIVFTTDGFARAKDKCEKLFAAGGSK